MLKLVMRRFASACTKGGLRAGARKPIKAFPSGKDENFGFGERLDAQRNNRKSASNRVSV